jgi:Tol biopolymer transport system component/tRNA A-37 threonylcarbamoyl transferase component Bud32
MKPELWEQIAQLHRAALEIEKGARAAFLTKACAGNEVLRREVESLLALEGNAENFMESSALEAVAEQLAKEQLPIRALKPGTKLGPYEILAPLGAGGMGEVYRARDSKLNREAALKILPAMFTDDAERMARFRREAQVLASLNHPNIGSIYGLEEWNNLRVLVLELVEGPTLADRITGGAIPLEEALEITRQIAEAMAYAHEKGVIHRDLKPANIKITPEGNVKVLDFGLAKVLQGPKNLDSDPSHSPTCGNPTLEGMILGTAAYMSPEQAKGKPVDKRADIWAFGVVLYELLTGRHLFQRETVSDTLAAVLKEEPDWNRIPVKVRPLLRHCLEKDPKRRLRDIGDMHLLLETASVPVQTHRPWLAWGAVAVFLVAFAALSLIHFRERPLVSAPVQFQISPSGRLFQGAAFAVSPDGRHLAFAATGSDGMARLWIRNLDSLEVRALSDTYPASVKPRVVVPPFFWSPDGRFIGFQSGGKLAKIEISGGPAQTLCDVQGTVVGGSWNRDDVIVFADNTRGLMRVSAAGGVASPLTTIDPSRKEVVHALPSFLPDGRHFLYLRASSTPENSGVYVGSLNTKPEEQDSRRLLATTSGPVYVPSSDSDSGQVLFLRQGTLMAQPFDGHRLEPSGEAVPIAEQVGSYIDYGLFSASSNGVLVYRSGAGQDYQLTWLDQQGRVLATVAEPGRYNSFALSPDGRRVAVSRTNPENTPNWDVWLLDVGRNTSTRLTYDQVRAAFPVWSADGSSVIFDSIHEGEFNLYLKSASGAGDERLLLKSTDGDKYATSSSRDGRFLLYTVENPETKSDLWVLPLQGDRKPTPFLRTKFNESSGQFSPDGHGIAYTSDESGSDEIYVREFSSGAAQGSWDAARKWLISKGGGTGPRWRGDGKQLFYVASDGKLMSVDISAKPVFEAGAPRPLFQLPPGFIGGDVTADGRRFLIGVPVAQSASIPFTVVLNWQMTLKK